jgi:very-short-patch-repair endonuclease
MKWYPPLAGAGGGQLRLVIEVDGYSHFQEEVILKDKTKEKAIKEVSFEVIRSTNMQVLKDT